MIQRKLFLIILLLLIPAGVVIAQPSTNYVTQRFMIMGGGLAASANYSVTGIIGQSSTSRTNSPKFKVSGGFLYPRRQDMSLTVNVWLPIILK